MLLQLCKKEDPDAALRPKRFSDYLGQRRLLERMAVYVGAARERKQAMDHVLLSGPPGLGKTSLAHVVAAELNARIVVVHAPAISHRGVLAEHLLELGEGDVLFIDEIHRLEASVEECLYPVMEDYRLDMQVGKKTESLPLPRFTLMGATTRAGMLSAPLRDRFGIQLALEYYTDGELADIAQRSARLMQVQMDRGGAEEMGRRARGTPRVVNRLLRRVRDAAQVQRQPITQAFADKALTWEGIDSRGLDEPCRKLLTCLITMYKGGPVGVAALAASCGEDRETVEEVYEPYLIQQGFISRTPRGRQAMPLTYQHLGLR